MDAWETHWKPVPLDTARQARVLGLACRLDRQLQEAAAAASRAEARLATALRAEVQAAVGDASGVESLWDKLRDVHAQLAYLPRIPLPAGITGLLRDLLGPGWDADVVVAGVPELAWPELAVAPERPVAVIPLAEARNPLMWPLVAVQGATAGGESRRAAALDDVLGAALAFARAEASCLADQETARAWWATGERQLVQRAADRAGMLAQLATTLGAGILISGYRQGNRVEADAPIYRQLAVVRDEPAQPADILTAGWMHWYTRTAGEVVELAARSAGQDEAGNAWWRMRALVDGLDDLLCRSLDVAAIHRFYAAEGAIG